MNNPVTITATLPAFLPSWERVDVLLKNVRDGNHKRAATIMNFTDCEMDKGSDPWTLVGEADITVRLFSENELTAAQLRALQAELDHARAEWLTRQAEILQRISKLQALANEVAA